MTEQELYQIVSEAVNGSKSPANMKLPEPELITYYTLENERKIWIDLSVDAMLLEYERMILRWNMEDKGKDPSDRKPIWIYLFNYGGSLDIMWSFIDIISASKTPVYTVNMGCCASAAAIIFVSGHKRFMMPMASVMIHKGSAQIAGDGQKVIDQADSYKKELKKMRNFITDHTSIPSRTLSSKQNNDWEIDAEYCLEHGVCDVIVSSLDDVI